MRHYVGFDVGKGARWVCVLDGEGEVVLSRRVEVTEEALEAVCSEIPALEVSDERVVGIDLTGGPGHCWRRYCSGRAVPLPRQRR